MTDCTGDTIARQRAEHRILVAGKRVDHIVAEGTLAVDVDLPLAHRAMAAIAKVLGKGWNAGPVGIGFGFELRMKHRIAPGESHQRCRPLAIG